MVAGVLPWLRYVLLTDRLAADLTPDELDAVFGHEVGHVKHHHMAYYASFFVLSITVLLLASTFFLPKGEYLRQIAACPVVGCGGISIFLVLRFLSRRCERQADIYGCRAVSCGRLDCAGHEHGIVSDGGALNLCPTGIRTFIGALEKVAELNG